MVRERPGRSTDTGDLPGELRRRREESKRHPPYDKAGRYRDPLDRRPEIKLSPGKWDTAA